MSCTSNKWLYLIYCSIRRDDIRALRAHRAGWLHSYCVSARSCRPTRARVCARVCKRGRAKASGLVGFDLQRIKHERNLARARAPKVSGLQFAVRDSHRIHVHTFAITRDGDDRRSVADWIRELSGAFRLRAYRCSTCDVERNLLRAAFEFRHVPCLRS